MDRDEGREHETGDHGAMIGRRRPGRSARTVRAGALAVLTLLTVGTLSACGSASSDLCKQAAAQHQLGELALAGITYAQAEREKPKGCGKKGLEAVARDQATVAIAVARAQAAERAHDTDDAIGQYARALRLDFREGTALYGLRRLVRTTTDVNERWQVAMALAANGYTDDARAEVARTLKENPKEPLPEALAALAPTPTGPSPTTGSTPGSTAGSTAGSTKAAGAGTRAGATSGSTGAQSPASSPRPSVDQRAAEQLSIPLDIDQDQGAGFFTVLLWAFLIIAGVLFLVVVVLSRGGNDHVIPRAFAGAAELADWVATRQTTGGRRGTPVAFPPDDAPDGPGEGPGGTQQFTGTLLGGSVVADSPPDPPAPDDDSAQEHPRPRHLSSPEHLQPEHPRPEHPQAGEPRPDDSPPPDDASPRLPRESFEDPPEDPDDPSGGPTGGPSGGPSGPSGGSSGGGAPGGPSGGGSPGGPGGGSPGGPSGGGSAGSGHGPAAPAPRSAHDAAEPAPTPAAPPGTIPDQRPHPAGRPTADHAHLDHAHLDHAHPDYATVAAEPVTRLPDTLPPAEAAVASGALLGAHLGDAEAASYGPAPVPATEVGDLAVEGMARQAHPSRWKLRGIRKRQNVQPAPSAQAQETRPGPPVELPHQPSRSELIGRVALLERRHQAQQNALARISSRKDAEVTSVLVTSANTPWSALRRGGGPELVVVDTRAFWSGKGRENYTPGSIVVRQASAPVPPQQRDQLLELATPAPLDDLTWHVEQLTELIDGLVPPPGEGRWTRWWESPGQVRFEAVVAGQGSLTDQWRSLVRGEPVPAAQSPIVLAPLLPLVGNQDLRLRTTFRLRDLATAFQLDPGPLLPVGRQIYALATVIAPVAAQTATARAGEPGEQSAVLAAVERSVSADALSQAISREVLDVLGEDLSVVGTQVIDVLASAGTGVKRRQQLREFLDGARRELTEAADPRA